jgi:hypothetical protein
MSTNLDYARESWEKAVELAEGIPALSRKMLGPARRANGEQTLTAAGPTPPGRLRPRKCRYKIAASNRRGGRSLTIFRLVLDELREHHDWSAWNAATNATNARDDAQAFALSNQGDAASIVLHQVRKDALTFIETGGGDPRFGLFEWSAPEGCELDDQLAIAAANPNVGRRTGWPTLLGPAKRAKLAGGDQEAGYRTEVLCQDVGALDPALDMKAWKRPAAEGGCFEVGTLDDARSRLAVGLEVSTDGRHVSLVAAVRVDADRTRVEPIAAWSGDKVAAEVRAELRGWLERIKPRSLGWLPTGPTAELAADLKLTGRNSIVPRSVRIEPLTGEATGLSMGFAGMVKAGQVLQSGDPLLDAQAEKTGKQRLGDRWQFARKTGNCDTVYAAAVAVHLARQLPVRVPGSGGIIRAGSRGGTTS